MMALPMTAIVCSATIHPPFLFSNAIAFGCVDLIPSWPGFTHGCPVERSWLSTSSGPTALNRHGLSRFLRNRWRQQELRSCESRAGRRPRPGYPRLAVGQRKAWMAVTSTAMTSEGVGPKSCAIALPLFYTIGSDRSRYPAIDADVLAGDVAGAVGDQERHRLRHLGDPAVTLHRDRVPPGLALRQAVEEAGQHVVHADVPCCVFVGVEFGEAGKPGAQHAGDRKGGIGLEGGIGRDIDEGAAALLLHDGRHQPCHVDDVEQDHVETLMPVGI